MQFTLKSEKDNMLNFLDITIIKDKDKFKYKTYMKPTVTDTTIHTDSNHPTNQKISMYPQTQTTHNFLLKPTIFRKN